MAKITGLAAAMGGHTAPYGRVWRWRQQQWEAVQGPMTHSGPGSSMRRLGYRGP
ncbi:unnamed protein product [Staurois parvus]|uniref:Uncharacterized protein n=1 Tax=Staurois parvus TaxID=386267 RepID=A0ABN9E0T7_9NEOB|nr:unnamed protein product [Staurois parvus]